MGSQNTTGSPLNGILPFQTELVVNRECLLPFRPLQIYVERVRSHASMVLKGLNRSTDMQGNAIMRSLHWNDPTMTCLVLGEGLDLRQPKDAPSHLPEMLFEAITKHSGPPNLDLSPDMVYPFQGACLTYLLLHARINSNIRRLRGQPASPIGHAVQSGRHELVSLLLAFRASAQPGCDDHPLFRAVLRAHSSTIDMLVQEGADMWQQATLGDLCSIVEPPLRPQ